MGATGRGHHAKVGPREESLAAGWNGGACLGEQAELAGAGHGVGGDGPATQGYGFPRWHPAARVNWLIQDLHRLNVLATYRDLERQPTAA
jgi:hypothetical protein